LLPLLMMIDFKNGLPLSLKTLANIVSDLTR